ncbi:MAG: hypothetical protein ACOX8Q_02035 [Christensenellales bacterium]|jgi:hypothetical protein
MNEDNQITLEGFTFTLTEYACFEGTTTVAVYVSGNGAAESDLSRWVLEVCSQEVQEITDMVDIVSCEKSEGNGDWVPAAAQKITYELTGDIGISGFIIEESVGKKANDPGVEFRVIFDKELPTGYIRVAYISDETIYRSTEKIHMNKDFAGNKIWKTPIEKTFCLYIIVSDGYKPLQAGMANVSITQRGVFIAHQTSISGLNNASLMPVKTNIQGCVKIIASVPLKNDYALGDDIEACACDCFELNETIVYTNEADLFDIQDVLIYPKKNSFDLTLLNAYCGKSVYRLDGKYIIDSKHEKSMR